MLVDTGITIAYKCSLCGSFEFFNMSLFALLHSKERSFSCHCGKSRILVAEEHSRDFRVTTPCIGCGNEHIFILRKKDILHRDINVFHCPVTGIQPCFIGRDEAVRRKVDSLEKELDALIDAFGYDNYFKNTQVMFDSLNRIHDIAERGNLYCECGSSDVELILLSDRINLRCKKCAASEIIYAASNKDLKDVLVRQHIELLNNCREYQSGNVNGFMRKTDGK